MPGPPRGRWRVLLVVVVAVARRCLVRRRGGPREGSAEGMAEGVVVGGVRPCRLVRRRRVRAGEGARWLPLRLDKMGLATRSLGLMGAEEEEEG